MNNIQKALSRDWGFFEGAPESSIDKWRFVRRATGEEIRMALAGWGGGFGEWGRGGGVR